MSTTVELAKYWLELGAVALDTETTGLRDHHEIIEVGVVDRGGDVLLQDLVVPTRAIPSDATEVHGITNEYVVECGKIWAEVFTDLESIFESRPVVIFNDVFDMRMITQTCDFHGVHDLDHESIAVFDLMKLANRHLIDHAEWCTHNSRFKRLSLARCCELMGVEFKGQAHRAVSDASAAMDLLQAIANSKPSGLN